MIISLQHYLQTHKFIFMENRFQLADAYIAKNSSVTDLYKSFWFENTTCLLHAPRERDKTAFALEIARSITDRGMTVFYLTTGRLHPQYLAGMGQNPRLYVHQSDFASPDDTTDYADIVFKDLEDAIAMTGAKIFIIDSLSRIADLSFGRNASETYLMKRIIALQARHRISILVTHHDKSKATTRTLTYMADCHVTIMEPGDFEKWQNDIAAKEKALKDSKDEKITSVNPVNDTRPLYFDSGRPTSAAPGRREPFSTIFG